MQVNDILITAIIPLAFFATILMWCVKDNSLSIKIPKFILQKRIIIYAMSVTVLSV